MEFPHAHLLNKWNSPLSLAALTLSWMFCLPVCLFVCFQSKYFYLQFQVLSTSLSLRASRRLYRFCITSASNQQRNGKGIRVFHFLNMRSLLQTFFCIVFESISYTYDIIRLALAVWEYPNAYCCPFSRTVRLETSVSCLVHSLSHSYNITITLKQFIYQIGSVLTANPRKRNLSEAGCSKYG